MAMVTTKAAKDAPARAQPEPLLLEGYRLEDQVGFHLRRASQRHGTIFSGHMTSDLTTTQWAALVKIAELGCVSQNHLGRETAMDAATIKGVVDRLIRRGLVKANSDPTDSRRSLITLTDEGRAVITAAASAARAITAATVEPLTAGEHQILIELLRKIS
jgi:MarR family transcriptional regulator, lower aerobic nicotinate degradation pathway regulator